MSRSLMEQRKATLRRQRNAAFSEGASGAYVTKDGYLFHMHGNSDTQLLKTLALGIARRL